MRNSILFLFLLASGFCYGQKKYPMPHIDTIIVNKDSINHELNNGSLTFLKICEWQEDMNVNGQAVSMTESLNSLVYRAQHSGKRGVYIHNIKMKNPDGTFKLLPSKQIIVK